MVKNFIKSAVLAAVLLLAVSGASAATCTVGQTLSVDPYGSNVIKLMRPTGTNNIAIVTTSGTVVLPSTSSCGGWSGGTVSGNANVFQSYDGVQGAGNTATAGLDAGYDAVAFIKKNIISITADPTTKCATYLLQGSNTGTLCTANYLDWIFSRP